MIDLHQRFDAIFEKKSCWLSGDRIRDYVHRNIPSDYSTLGEDIKNYVKLENNVFYFLLSVDK